MRRCTDADVIKFIKFLDSHVGQGAAVLTRDIVYRSDMGIFIEAPGATKHSDQRWVRAIVNKARLEGHPIVGLDSGYFLADNVEELSHAVNKAARCADRLMEVADVLSDIDLNEYWKEKEVNQ